MKKPFYIVLVVIILLSLILTIVACDNKKNPKEPLIKLQDYVIPDDLGEYGLTIEWLSQSGEKTSFNPKKPIVMLFEGAVPNGYKSGFSLDSSIYTFNNGEGSIAPSSKGINHNLAYYWWHMGYNVGVFHYENYAVGALNDIVKKIYNSQSINYVNSSGHTVYPSDSEFSLTEVFVYLWLSMFKVNPIIDTDVPDRNSQEIKFIGNSVGANLAISIADFLYSAYDEGLIPPYAVPNRLSLTNPYFSNENINVGVDFRQDSHTSPLAYNESRMSELARQGVVFEVIESDPNFFQSYAKPYTGLVETDKGLQLGETGDSAIYKSIKNNSAYLTLSQSYDSFYTEQYKALDRAALDWYLYSINGSDDTMLDNSSYAGPNNTRPMSDNITSYVSGRMYSVSAWTPTPYIRAVKGVEYKMLKKSYNSETGNYDKEALYTMTKFQAEAFQCSDLTKSLVCGYVYVSKNKSKFVNWGADTPLNNVEIIIQLESNDQSGKGFYKVRTSSDGFYSFELEPKYYESTIKVSVILPNAGYAYSYDREITEGYYQKYTISTINRAEVNLDQSYMQINSGLVQILLNNCGLIEL